MSPSTPNPLPPYIYKILPSSAAPPHPLPVSLPLAALDSSARSGTSSRPSGTSTTTYVLRIPYARVADLVVWEDAEGRAPAGDEGPTGFFPHVYANAGPGEGEGGGGRGEGGTGLEAGEGKEVESGGLWERGGGNWTTHAWPFGEDAPRE
ncbi:hypothetical protein MBM_05693 [Drepanopeziza brunnea f. sp. 'multigermtubi' MB_m1]|uniref:Uncharacterized protein n=1 Tax=Marssonina brunnea f. sp. multigermtubi (strain MB_m1) TaxID=1072389 RepID=K1XUJ0_MARBU|nr:uncharacterized protein MBM_05693 [Drepanopeziza brunnea f. sp. 'multigermtubi' MB_m1]EKD16399.1 hypothetical protein MBM_05693 [Drepanopeziza brunnea f. sp. 'multigermtubi' MB_m1]